MVVMFKNKRQIFENFFTKPRLNFKYNNVINTLEKGIHIGNICVEKTQFLLYLEIHFRKYNLKKYSYYLQVVLQKHPKALSFTAVVLKLLKNCAQKIMRTLDY